MKNFLKSQLPVGLVSGVVVAGAMLATGVGDNTTTKYVSEQAPLSSTRPVSANSTGLTARDIYKRDAPGVVNIRSQIVRTAQSQFDPFPQEQQGVATGSGFVLDKDGYILTNAHVIAGASKVTVTFEDKKSVDARVVGKDVSSDIALLKIDPKGIPLKPLGLGDSKTAQVGDPTVAIGNPFGLDRTLTTGVVSALQRQITAPNGFSIDNVIQTDAAINPGNSGGPLIDANGRVIGINSQIATGSSGNGNVGIGFAVPINTAKTIIPQLRKDGRVAHAYLGITGATIDDSFSALNLASKRGVLIQNVRPGSPAAKAGLKGGDARAQLNGQPIILGGDVITKLDGKDIKSMQQVSDAVGAKKPGDTISLGIVRGGKSSTVKVKLANRPLSAGQG